MTDIRNKIKINYVQYTNVPLMENWEVAYIKEICRCFIIGTKFTKFGKF